MDVRNNFRFIKRTERSFETLFPECGPNKFECSDGSCIWQAWVCDQDTDCPGGEDEDEEVCKGREVCTPDEYR